MRERKSRQFVRKKRVGRPSNNLLLLALKTYKLRPTFFFPSSSMRATMKMMMKMKMRMTLVMSMMMKETNEEVMNIRMGVNISPAVHCSVPLDRYPFQTNSDFCTKNKPLRLKATSMAPSSQPLETFHSLFCPVSWTIWLREVIHRSDRGLKMTLIILMLTLTQNDVSISDSIMNAIIDDAS